MFRLKAATTTRAAWRATLNVCPQLVFTSTRRQNNVVCDQAEEVKDELDTRDTPEVVKRDESTGLLLKFLFVV